jgi:hypothetical protein
MEKLDCGQPDTWRIQVGEKLVLDRTIFQELLAVGDRIELVAILKIRNHPALNSSGCFARPCQWAA